MNETILTGSAAVAEGQSVLKSGASGFHRRMASEAHRVRVHAAGVLFGRAYNGDLHAQADLKEAMSTSDFPILFGDFMQRTLAARYATRPPVWQQFAARTTVRDFRPAKIIDLLGGAGLLEDVPELAPYPERALSEAEIEITVGKKGARLQWSWEMGINDDLGAFQRAPEGLSRGSRSTEDFTVTSAIVDAAGPTIGTPATGGGTALSRDALNVGLAVLNEAVDEDGNPIDVGVPVLMVPAALQLTAQNIINTTQVRSQHGTGSGSTLTDEAGNGLMETPRIVVNRWLTAIDQSGTKNSTWYLLPDPAGPRPAVFAAFLRGHEQPDLRVKSDAGMALGGGAIDPAEGSFERDSVEYRIRHVIGGAQGFEDAVYVAKGA